MYLYKYLSNNRIDVIQNLQIRFTQPHYLNDPFEAFPIIKGSGFSSKEMTKAILKKASERNVNPKPYLNEEGLYSEEKFSEIVPFILNAVNQTTGILSLSENYDNLLLWSHYANNHKGYVLAFDSNHAFFHSIERKKIQLSKVRYTIERPKGTLMEILESDFITTKPLQWSYEEEWRLSKPTYLANKIAINKTTNHAICLFNIPHEAIKGIYIGANMSPREEKKIIKLCKERGKDFFIKKMVIDPEKYGLAIFELKDWEHYQYELSKDPTLDILSRVNKYMSNELLKKINS